MLLRRLLSRHATPRRLSTYNVYPPSSRSYTSRPSSSARASFPMTPCCPSPPPCSAPPTLAPKLPDTHPLASAGLHGAMAAYLEHIVLCTGTNAWPSRIDDDGEPGADSSLSGPAAASSAAAAPRNLAAEFKQIIGRNGPLQNPNFSVIASSLPLPQSNSSSSSTSPASVYLLPSFKYVSALPDTASLSRLVKEHLLPLDKSSRTDGATASDTAEAPVPFTPVSSVMVLICGHKNRDLRCAVYGPALQDAFTHELDTRGIQVLHSPPDVEASDASSSTAITARVAMISHIGGHKYAGNVIIYIPPGLRGPDGNKHSLAGCGIWYGRVDPEHVSGIIQETIINGKVIEKFFRGGLNADRQIVRI
ncbi:hypothetical protein BROUX41_000797 [Berkeleyomyces rouxiae]|uniref:uncharacterized protein n=1 Tax=Berkeleyomyces rouxiae TaxID=2035830 RepID=UPI003B826F1F